MPDVATRTTGLRAGTGPHRSSGGEARCHRRPLRPAPRVERYALRYTTTLALVNELAEADAGRRLSSVIARYGKVGLLRLDEFGYLNLDKKGVKPLFQIFTEPDECKATAVATNSPFAVWARPSDS